VSNFYEGSSEILFSLWQKFIKYDEIEKKRGSLFEVLQIFFLFSK